MTPETEVLPHHSCAVHDLHAFIAEGTSIAGVLKNMCRKKKLQVIEELTHSGARRKEQNF